MQAYCRLQEAGDAARCSTSLACLTTSLQETIPPPIFISFMVFCQFMRDLSLLSNCFLKANINDFSFKCNLVFASYTRKTNFSQLSSRPLLRWKNHALHCVSVSLNVVLTANLKLHHAGCVMSMPLGGAMVIWIPTAFQLPFMLVLVMSAHPPEPNSKSSITSMVR